MQQVRSSIRSHPQLHSEEAGPLLKIYFQPLLEGPNKWGGCAKNQGRQAARHLENTCRAGEEGGGVLALVKTRGMVGFNA